MGASFFHKDLIVVPKAYVPPPVWRHSDVDLFMLDGFGEAIGSWLNSNMTAEDTLRHTRSLTN